MSDFLVIFFKKIIYININLLFTLCFTISIIKVVRIKNLNIKYILWSMIIIRFLYDLIFYTPSPAIVSVLPEHGTLTIGLGSGLNLKTLTASLWDNYGTEFTAGDIISVMLGTEKTLYLSFFILLTGIYFFIRSLIEYFTFQKNLRKTFKEKILWGKTLIYISDHIESPFVIGILKPVIVVPKTLMCCCTENELNTIIEHETAHIKRKDHIIFGILSFIKPLFIYILPLNIVIEKLEEIEEKICDRMVIKKGKDKITLASTILKVVEFQAALKELKRKTFALNISPAFAKIKKRIEGRIENIYTPEDSKGITLKLRFIEISTYLISYLFVIGSKVF